MTKVFLKGTYKIITLMFTIAFLLQNFSPKHAPIDEVLCISATMAIILIYGIGSMIGSYKD